MAERTAEERRAVLAGRVILIGAVFSVVAIVPYVPLYSQTRAWQILVAVTGIVLGAACLAPAHRLARQGKLDAAGYWVLLALVTTFGTGELMWADATLPQTASAILLVIIASGVFRPRRWGVWLATACLYVICAVLVNRFVPWPRFDIMQHSPATLLTPVPLALAVLWLVARAFRIGTIRTRLLLAFVAMALLLALSISGVSAVLGFENREQQVISGLDVVAAFKESKMDAWVSSLQTDLDDVLADEITALVVRTVLEEHELLFSDVHGALRRRLQSHIRQTKLLEELFLLDLQGQVVVSTAATQEGTLHGDQTYFQEGLKGVSVQLPFYSSALGQTLVLAVRPVVDEQGQVLGVLAGRPSMARLNEIVSERTGLGQTGETYLVDADYTMLTSSRFAEEAGVEVRSQGTSAAIEDQVDGSAVYQNHRGVEVIGVYHWLPELWVALLVEQDQAEAFSPIYATMRVNGGVTLGVVLLAVVASLFITRSIAAPLADLAETATQIAAGDLARVAKVERADEIGALAQSFNSMTTQLRELIGSLEQRVADRTSELEQRSAYLQASAEVGRAATSILEIDRLMRQVVDLIRERFSLYYVGLFLVDGAGEWAALRAGTGEFGQTMLARGHRLAVGGDSMIGQCVARDEARVALDVGEEAARFDNPLLPDTRSELALPLHSRGRVIGAMSVQSVEEAAFDKATIAVLQAMADQVAVALDNARLFVEAQAALEAARSAHGEMSRAAWRDLLRVQPDIAYRSDERGAIRAGDVWQPEMERALREGEVVRGAEVGAGEKRPLAVPIKVRGNVIGVLDTYKPGDADDWTPEEIALLETLADQLGLALESARLYEDAQRRAARERLTSEITDKMRRAADVEGIVQAAVDELFSVLGTSRAFVRLEPAPLARDSETWRQGDEEAG